MLGEIYQLVCLHGLEIGAYLKSQYQCGCYLSTGCIDRSPLLVVGFSRSLLECIESCTYVTCELSLTRYNSWSGIAQTTPYSLGRTTVGSAQCWCTQRMPGCSTLYIQLQHRTVVIAVSAAAGRERARRTSGALQLMERRRVNRAVKADGMNGDERAVRCKGAGRAVLRIV